MKIRSGGDDGGSFRPSCPQPRARHRIPPRGRSPDRRRRSHQPTSAASARPRDSLIRHQRQHQPDRCRRQQRQPPRPHARRPAPARGTTARSAEAGDLHHRRHARPTGGHEALEQHLDDARRAPPRTPAAAAAGRRAPIGLTVEPADQTRAGQRDGEAQRAGHQSAEPRRCAQWRDQSPAGRGRPPAGTRSSPPTRARR